MVVHAEFFHSDPLPGDDSMTITTTTKVRTVRKEYVTHADRLLFGNLTTHPLTFVFVTVVFLDSSEFPDMNLHVLPFVEHQHYGFQKHDCICLWGLFRPYFGAQSEGRPPYTRCSLKLKAAPTSCSGGGNSVFFSVLLCLTISRTQRGAIVHSSVMQASVVGCSK